eukprot:scaffold792_cov122-Isochrysis_galbana.AAC.3
MRSVPEGCSPVHDGSTAAGNGRASLKEASVRTCQRACARARMRSATHSLYRLVTKPVSPYDKGVGRRRLPAWCLRHAQLRARPQTRPDPEAD